MNKFLSRSFWIIVYFGSIAGVLDWFKDTNSFTVVAPAAFTGWFGMKVAERLKNGNNGSP